MSKMEVHGKQPPGTGPRDTPFTRHNATAGNPASGSSRVVIPVLITIPQCFSLRELGNIYWQCNVHSPDAYIYHTIRGTSQTECERNAAAVANALYGEQEQVQHG